MPKWLKVWVSWVGGHINFGAGYPISALKRWEDNRPVYAIVHLLFHYWIKLVIQQLAVQNTGSHTRMHSIIHLFWLVTFIQFSSDMRGVARSQIQSLTKILFCRLKIFQGLHFRAKIDTLRKFFIFDLIFLGNWFDVICIF